MSCQDGVVGGVENVSLSGECIVKGAQKSLRERVDLRGEKQRCV